MAEFVDDDLDLLMAEIDFDEDVDVFEGGEISESDDELEPVILHEDNIADFLDDDLPTNIARLPKIVFVSDDNVHTVVSEGRSCSENLTLNSSTATTPLLQCKNCKKSYKRQHLNL